MLLNNANYNPKTNFIITSVENEDDKFCDKCVKDFDEAEGCKCRENHDCDPLQLIPQECFKCGEKAMEYCDTKKGIIFETLIYQLFYILLDTHFSFSTFFTSIFLASTNSQCKTVGGPDPFKKCVFPFKWNGNTYYGCPTDPDDRSKTWCSTKVDTGGNHVTGQKKYGFCNEVCPKHSSIANSKGNSSIKIPYFY